MSSQGSLTLFNISWIFWSKNKHLVLFTVFLNYFQSTRLLVDLYFSRPLLQLMFYQLFEYLEILIIFEFFSQVLLIALANESTAFSSDSTLVRKEVSIIVMFLIMSLMNTFSSALSLMIEHFLLRIYCFSIGILMVKEVWSKTSLHSG